MGFTRIGVCECGKQHTMDLTLSINMCISNVEGGLHSLQIAEETFIYLFYFFCYAKACDAVCTEIQHTQLNGTCKIKNDFTVYCTIVPRSLYQFICLVILVSSCFMRIGMFLSNIFCVLDVTVN